MKLNRFNHVEPVKGRASELTTIFSKQERCFVAYLPTEFVANNPTDLLEKMGFFAKAYAYRLKDSTEYAMEVWNNYGSDGHMEMTEVGHVILKENELPKNYDEYRDLVGG